ncbi:DUF6798 domain-containing protein [Granulicella sibirica]|uniref:Glycosyltransferase RgtA/B/C/D-like domain-containing protein n=1 Tax=Granulicella sibirica TaxID=2479048 RepID=A0A4Q0SZN2_9BACT|nr:DUF6798 domain-containing protein [Granulicella sibirica]RXH56745.1 hypothetical protein GRAN_0055 [Granulicella sibirica]
MLGRLYRLAGLAEGVSEVRVLYAEGSVCDTEGVPVSLTETNSEQDGGWAAAGWVTVLTLVGIGILGYHPYSEDGALYVAEVKHALNPALYPHGTAFVTGHLGLPCFALGVTGLVKLTGLALPMVLFLLYAACIWGMLFGVWQLAANCYESRQARLGATGLVAVWLTMPVAGTSLLLMDPYVTARSVSLAMTLLGMAGLVGFCRRRSEGVTRWELLAWGLGAFGVAALAHPLMAFYGLVATSMLRCVTIGRPGLRVSVVWIVSIVMVTAAAMAQVLAPAETANYVRVASTRPYWFLAEWRWFEWFGLAAPLAILAWVGWGPGRRWTSRDRVRQGLGRMAVAVGSLAVLIAIAFARQGARVHPVAKLQPLRSFQIVYVVMLIVLGAALGQFALRRSFARWVGALVVLGGIMVVVERMTYPNSGHLELPGLTPSNEWEQVFLWVKQNTPEDSLFALDPDYVGEEGEDTQGFRAIAERSVLPDYSKDGGIAAIRSGLTEDWVAGQAVQARLSEESDAERVAALGPAGVTWIVLGRGAVTGFACPFENGRAKVCRVPGAVENPEGPTLATMKRREDGASDLRQ